MAAPANNGQISPPNTAIGAVGGQPVIISPEWYRYFAQRQKAVDGSNSAALITIDTEQDVFPNSRRLQVSAADLAITTGSVNLTLGLANTAVAAGTYGGATKLIVLAVDAKGRITSASEVDLNSDNVIEGSTNLFFTQARARGSVSGSAGVSYVVGTGVFSLDQAFVRGLLSGGSHINYNSGTGAIAFSGTGVSGTFTTMTSVTVSDGLITSWTP
jgi:hypothetical protein